MLRRLLLATGMVALVSSMLPGPLASASNDPDDHAAAAITGNVTVGKGPCTASPDKFVYANLPAGPTDLVTFNQVAMAGKFNNYVGGVMAPGGITACTVALGVVPPPFNQLAGWGRIRAGGTFTGNEAIATNKCVRGRVGAAATPAGASAGDFLQVGVVAVVKFDISYETGNLNSDGDCVNLGKDNVDEIDCVGTIAVAPVGSIQGGGNDPVAGSVVCHNALPSNKGDKRG